MKTTIALLILASAAACAAPQTFTTSGTFPGSVASTPYFGPNETFSVTLTVDSHPTPTNYSLGGFTAVPITNVSYLVNGAQTYNGPGYITFNSEGFILCLDPACYYTLVSFSVSPGKMYSGLESAPTILAGGYMYGGQAAYVVTPPTYLYTYYTFGTSIPASIAAAVPSTPAPPGLYLCLLGIASLGLYALSKRTRALPWVSVGYGPRTPPVGPR
jgi:hypothetical protein